MKFDSESSEFRLLLLAVRTEDPVVFAKQDRAAICSEKMDWARLSIDSKTHGIRPELEKVLKSQG